MKSNRAAMTHPEVQKLVENPAAAGFDVVTVCCTLFGEEPGYFLADRFNASLVLYHAKLFSNPWINWNTGNPLNPAYMSTFFVQV